MSQPEWKGEDQHESNYQVLKNSHGSPETFAIWLCKIGFSLISEFLPLHSGGPTVMSQLVPGVTTTMPRAPFPYAG
jgi:hypothetical protein